MVVARGLGGGHAENEACSLESQFGAMEKLWRLYTHVNILNIPDVYT